MLAGRLLAGDLLRIRLAPALAVLLACYTAALGFDVAQRSVPAYDQPLADWLVAHDFSYGLSNYYTGNITTLDSGGRVHLAAVSWGADKSVPRAYQSDSSWYNQQSALRQLHHQRFRRPAAGPYPVRRPGQGVRPGGLHNGPTRSWCGTRTCWPTSARPAREGPGNVGP